MMEFGMPSLLELDTLEQQAAFCRELNLSFVELNMNLPQYQLDRMDGAILQRIAEKYDVYFTIHLDENLNACDFNRVIADGYLDTVLKTIRLAKAVECIPVLNMHMAKGVYFTLPEQKIYLFERYRENYMERLKFFRTRCSEEIGDLPIRICIENTDGYPSFLQEAIDFLLKADCFSLTWDVGHDFGCGEKDREFILNRWECLSHFHLHDSFEKESHLPLGSGKLDLKEKIGLAEMCDARCVIEVKTKQAVCDSVEYLREVFADG